MILPHLFVFGAVAASCLGATPQSGESGPIPISFAHVSSDGSKVAVASEKLQPALKPGQTDEPSQTSDGQRVAPDDPVWEKKQVDVQVALSMVKIPIEFRFKNVTRNKLLVKAVEATCGCTHAHADKAEYLPLEFGLS